VLAWNTGDNQPDCLPMIADQTVMLNSTGLTYLEMIVWRKSGAVYSIPRSAHIRTHHKFYPALCWEPVIIFKNGKLSSFDSDDEDAVSKYGINVWDIPQVVGLQQTKTGHPAMFPVELASRVIRAYSTRGRRTYDVNNSVASVA